MGERQIEFSGMHRDSKLDEIYELLNKILENQEKILNRDWKK